MTSRPTRRRTALPAAALAVTLALTLGAAGASASDPAPPPDGTITGADGVEYPRAPKVVSGRDGDLFDGYTFDVICASGGKRLEASLDRLAKVARIIDASGRRVVFTVAPPKALVNEDNVVRRALPHGRCDRRGLDQQRTVFDTYPDPRFLRLRRPLAADRRQVFWRTDPHWTTIGASVFTKALASRLDPDLGRLQRYRPGPPQSAVGASTSALGDDTPETVPSVVPRTRVRVEPLPGTPAIGLSTYVSEHEWRSSPARLTHPGRTTVIGDSFTYMGLVNLRPILRRGHFLWFDNPYEKLVGAIRRSDTVVIQIAHLFAGVTPLGTKRFRDTLRKALR